MSLELIRVLFPRWNFFDRVSSHLVLEVKQSGTREWLPFSFNASRTWGGLFINPDVTRLHAEMSLLENFAADIQNAISPDGRVDSKVVQQLTTFKMIQALIMNRLVAGANESVQFRLSAQAGDELVVIYVSDILVTA